MRDFIHIMAYLKDNYSIDMVRILIILHSFSGKSGRKSFRGVTKLAKIDFLLRYPIYLEKSVQIVADSSRLEELRSLIDIKGYERNSIESTVLSG